jgi:hypothetical protein
VSPPLKGYPGVARAVESGRVVATTRTREDGTFTLTVKPGSYVIQGMWRDVCGAPCGWETATCGETGPIDVKHSRVRGVVVTCDLK